MVIEAWASAAAVAFIGALCAAAHLRLFSKLPAGFRLMLTVALTGAGVATAIVLGGWAYDEARAHVLRQQVAALTDVGQLAEERLRQDITDIDAQLESVAEDGLVQRSRTDPKSTAQVLADVAMFNHRVLQLCVLDRDAKLLASSSTCDPREPLTSIAVAYALAAKPYVSEPYRSPVYDREVLLLSAGCETNGGDATTITGAVTMRYDLQSAMAEMMRETHFAGTGYAVFADANGRVIAHPDPARVGQDYSKHPVFQRALAEDRPGWLITRRDDGVDRLYLYRKIASPASLGGAPIVLLAEMDAAEALAPVAHLAHVFEAATCAVAAVWAVVAVLLARSVTRPLRDVVSVCTKIGAGDLAARGEPTGPDEFGLLTRAVNDMAAGLQERDRIKQTFGRYVTTQIAETILNQPNATLGGQRKRITILFADIRNFTTMSEAMQPEQVVEFLNQYFSEMVDAVFEFHGVLDKFIGDGIMALFGSVEPDPNPERRAVQTALRMRAKLAKLNAERANLALPPINIGIGIHTADVVLGNIGSKDRLDFTVIGDGVNTCSRVESANKELGTTLLITADTLAHVEPHFDTRPMPTAHLKGKSNIPALYEVLSQKPTTKAA